MFIDERATDEQAEKLGQVFSGQLGGPMAALAPLVGEMLGVERAAIEIEDDGLRHSVRIGDASTSRSRTSSRSGSRTGEPVRFDGMFHPAGSDLTIAEATRSRINAFGIEYEGQDRPVEVRFRLGRVSRARRARRPRPRPGPACASAFGAARARLGLVALLLALAARRVVVDRRSRCSGMDEGPWTGLGTFGWFVGVWVVMMAAMMLPSVAPTVALYARMTRGRSPLAPLLFTAGYLLTWTAVGVGAFLLALAGRHLVGDVLDWSNAGRWVAGGTLVVAAVYELTPLKDVCLGKCRSPLGFLLGAWRDGAAGAVEMGARHGAWCVGCCWALMAALFALGVMSIAWMAFVAALIAVEKLLPWGRVATYGTAAVLLALGVLMLAAPDAIPGLTVSGDGGGMPAMHHMDAMDG